MIAPFAHLLTFGLYPILFLYFHNLDKLGSSALKTTLLPLLTLALLSVLFLNRRIKDLGKSASIVSIFFFLFFLYGHIASFAPNIYFSTPIGPVNEHFAMIPAWWICTLSILKTVAYAKNTKTLSSALNYIGIALVISSLVTALPQLRTTTPKTLDNTQTQISNSELPDIYHIVLDGHAREDILMDLYGFDNSGFTHNLEEMGFYVAHKSRSNYAQTYLSMASTFDMAYVNYLENSHGRDSNDRSPLKELIKNGDAINNLRKLGYKIINIESGWAGSENLNSDLKITKQFGVNEFQTVLLGATPITYIFGEDFRFHIHKNSVLKSFEILPEITKIEDHTLTYAHILSPHPPFIFDKNGNYLKQNVEFDRRDLDWKPIYGRTTEMYKNSYAEQLQFIDKLTLEALHEIIANSPQKPIIILQSDHGPASTYFNFKSSNNSHIERTANLLAYYFPSDESSKLYSTITPVNTYRVIFNTYFSANYPILEDKIYFSAFEKPYDFKDVTDELKKIDEATPN